MHEPQEKPLVTKVSLVQTDHQFPLETGFSSHLVRPTVPYPLESGVTAHDYFEAPK
jgi:hypothetical protein